MYHPGVIAARFTRECRNPHTRVMFPNGVPRLPVKTAWLWRDRLATLQGPKGELIRPLTGEEDRIVSGERILTKFDFRYWAERYCQISLAATSLGPLYPLWESQAIILERIGDIEKQIVDGRRSEGIFINCLKARQLGASTLAQALLCHRLTCWAHTTVLLASDVPASSDHLFDMQERMIDHLPWYLRPAILERVKNDEIVFGTGSRLLWGAGKSTRGQSREQHGAVTGAKGQLGRGLTVALCHLSELSTWDLPGQIDDALLPAMPTGAMTLAIFESTAKGRHNWWHEHWLGAKTEGAGREFSNVFIPWYAEPTRYSKPAPENWRPQPSTLTHAMRAATLGPRFLGHRVSLTRDQLYWYETQRQYYTQKGELKKFFEEYAADDEECFQYGGESVFPLAVLDRLQGIVDTHPPLAYLAIEPQRELARLRIERQIAQERGER